MSTKVVSEPKLRTVFVEQAQMGYVTNWLTKTIYVRYSDNSSDREIAAAVRQFQADERYDNIRNIIHDFTDCQGLTFSEDFLAELAATDAAAALSKPKHNILVVTTRADVIKMTEAYLASGFIPRDKLRIFDDLNSALATVG